MPSDATAVGAAYPWLDYTGRWGQREKSFYNGPTGPNTKDQWTEPLTWTDTEGAANAYAVPASGLFGTQATSSFCGIVTSGSEALRVAMNNPALAALALLALGVVILWLVRRTTWTPLRPAAAGRAAAAPARSSPPCGGCTWAACCCSRASASRSPSRRCCPASPPCG